MSTISTKRRPRVRLDDMQEVSKKRVRIRLSPPTEDELIAAYVKKNGITKCPPKSVETVRSLYTPRTEIDRLKELEVQVGKDTDRIQKLKDHRMRILKKTEAWIQLLKREGKPIPKGLETMALRQA